MEFFNHIKTVISIILSLGIGGLLNGTVKFIQHPGRTKPYWLHLLLVFYVFLQMIHFWWWEYNLRGVQVWTFTEYILIIVYILLYFTLCQLLYPSDVKDYSDSYRNYFFSRKKWIFLGLAMIYVVDILDTLLKGSAYFERLMPLYGIKMISHISLCIILAFSKSKKSTWYAVMVIFFILFELYFIASKYYID
ncbi:hypothetical protein [Chryseobacterium sp. ISL-6]|uniref:hypothetical protein n=1 Tax=Chryseobacterium sp. ISL-6 TaxID=2819143 RepID=UPI001BE5DB8A|nr:hypothetical protein [Chryseobacterium sp. ISL-6]MBT2620079.1 hypothetical protein [Chryseobacterium sp. ISL-6]